MYIQIKIFVYSRRHVYFFALIANSKVQLKCPVGTRWRSRGIDASDWREVIRHHIAGGKSRIVGLCASGFTFGMMSNISCLHWSAHLFQSVMTLSSEPVSLAITHPFKAANRASFYPKLTTDNLGSTTMVFLSFDILIYSDQHDDHWSGEDPAQYRSLSSIPSHNRNLLQNDPLSSSLSSSIWPKICQRSLA